MRTGVKVSSGRRLGGFGRKCLDDIRVVLVPAQPSDRSLYGSGEIVSS